MNYRHAFHAGNFADCVKHAVLVWLLRALARKDKPFCILDTHAGRGMYDLASEEALRTGEARDGILRLRGAGIDPVLADYLGVVDTLGLYPGSPAIARALMRGGDQLIACEKHPEEAVALRRWAGRVSGVSVHERDGWEALAALLPPAARRGLVLIDPPYEEPDEYSRAAAGLRTGLARFPGGVFAVWYPVKGRGPVRGFHDALRAAGLRDLVAAELLLREPLDTARLNGCGLLVANPPWRFDEEVPVLLEALLAKLGRSEAGAQARVVRVAGE